MQLIVKFFKTCWKVLNFVRNLVMNLVFVFFMLLLFVLVSLALNGKEEKPELVGKQGALWLNLDGYLSDNRAPKDDWNSLLRELRNDHTPVQISTFDLVYAIESAKKDDRIQGLVLDLNYFAGADLPAISYVGKAIQHFKQSNKPVIALADNYSQSQYLLASYADEIYLNNIGEVDIHGLAYENLYFKSLLEKLEITPHIFRVGTYKSAVEPFLRNDMSPEAKQNAEQWLSQMWQSYQQIVAKNRNIAQEQVLPEPKTFLAELKKLNGDMSAYSKARNLVSQSLTRAQSDALLIEKFGENDEFQPKSVDFDTYLAALPDRLAGENKNAEHKIAVINVEGVIVDGGSSPEDDEVGGDTIARLLRSARHDENVEAVILRINSPGGSAFASDIIGQEIANLQSAGKVVVASMGNMAASGGYWIASNADYIIADPNTITGSIGIFAMFPTFENSIKKIGVNADGISTGKFAETSEFKGVNKETGELLQLQVEFGYDQFLNLVSKGRGLSKAQVDKVAQGQVWLGTDALKHKLVDELGDFDLAVTKAGELVMQRQQNQELKFDVEWLVDEEEEFWQRMLKNSAQQGKTLVRTWLLENIGISQAQYQQAHKQFGLLQKMNDPKGQYLYCLTCGTVK